jgi:hypothetical protein
MYSSNNKTLSSIATPGYSLEDLQKDQPVKLKSLLGAMKKYGTNVKHSYHAQSH